VFENVGRMFPPVVMRGARLAAGPGMADSRAVYQRAHRAAGFTLIELLVVLAILGLMVALVTPQVLKYLGRAKTDTARIEIQTLGNALDLYRLDMQHYPTQDEGLQALVEAPAGADNWRGPYLKQRKMPLDPWGHPYIYRAPGEHGEYDLYTLGADNAPGGSGENQDVTNW
jgi:general secretion pathway protein G